ncbi:MAG: T9SS type A sorting domain-containing protein, partial [Bacteroidales bacterium]|nr:T9SS type A sorting domain-containing protein [Bacteroidales bacterium]
VLLLFFFSFSAKPQQTLHQLIVVSGGAFSNPNDFVSLSAYFPTTTFQNNFGEILTQAVQHAVVDGERLYVTATDSLIVFDLNNYQKLSAIPISGPRKMLVDGDFLYVSIQYPEIQDFIRVYNKHSLELISVIAQVSGEAAGMINYDGKIFVAVPGDWTSLVGKLAILNASNSSFIEEINLEGLGIGIHDLFIYNGNVVTVNRSPWGSVSGILTFFNPISKQVDHYTFPYTFGKGIAVHNNILYLVMNNGIGSIDLNTRLVVNPSIVSDPGSANFIYFADVVYDDISNLFYATTTDYFSFGAGHVFNLSGVQIANFTAGISPETLALDFRNVSGLITQDKNLVSVYPNPVQERINLRNESSDAILEIQITSISGKNVFQKTFTNSVENEAIVVSELSIGVYILVVSFENGKKSRVKFVKQ